MTMGRKRKSNKDLPKGVYKKNGAYHFVHNNKWTKIGRISETTLYDIKKWYLENVDIRHKNSPTMGDLFIKFEKHHVPKLKNENTRKEYSKRLEILNKVFGALEPSEVTKRDIRKFMNLRAEQKTPATANHDFSTLSSAMTYMVDCGELDINPCIGIKKLTYKVERRFINLETFNAVRGIQPARIQAAMDLYYLTGRRMHELLRMTKADVTEQGLRFELDKKEDQTYKTILWSDELRKAYKFALSTHPHRFCKPIICNLQGKSYTAGGFGKFFTKKIKDAIKRGDLDEKHYFSVHDLRRFNAASDPKNATDRLGHTDKRVTDVSYLPNESISEPLK